MERTAERAVRRLPTLWAWLLGLLLLGPALGVGYVLTYDMVWVPDLALRSDFLGWGTALPRAVPSDLVVAVVDQVVPGMLLQKVVLLGALVAGGTGAARLAGPTLVGRLVATSVYVWSPFVVERLVIGHWPLLLCWAVLPWLVVAAARYRVDGRVGAALPLLLVVGSLSANAGVISAATLLAVAVVRRARPLSLLVLLVAVANAPWLVAGLLHASAATSTAGGSVFALHGEGRLPAPVAALTLGGIWNAETVPDSRRVLVLALTATVLVLVAAAYGVRPAWRRLGGRTVGALLGLGAAGYLLAVLTWLAPGSTDWLAAHLPGGGLVRDGARWLLLAAPASAVLVAAGCVRLADRLREPRLRRVAAVGMVLAPLALMPDAAWGASGALRAVPYPDDYAATRTALADHPAGDLLVLPFTSYRAPAWNGGRKVLDPLPRYLQPNYLVADDLAVGGRVVAGEDPRGPQVLAALALPTPEARATALAGLGVALVAREHGVPTTATYDAPVAGRVLHDGPDVEVVRLPGPVTLREPSDLDRALLIGAWLAFAGLVLAGVGNMFYTFWRGNSRLRWPR